MVWALVKGRCPFYFDKCHPFPSLIANYYMRTVYPITTLYLEFYTGLWT